MYIHIYVFIHSSDYLRRVCTFIYIYIYTYAYAYILCIYIYIHNYIIYIYIYIHAQIHNMYKCVRGCVCVLYDMPSMSSPTRATAEQYPSLCN